MPPGGTLGDAPAADGADAETIAQARVRAGAALTEAGAVVSVDTRGGGEPAPAGAVWGAAAPSSSASVQ